MSIFTKVVPESQLQLEYNYAKIKADPYNYTLTDRVLFYDTDTCALKYNIFSKLSNTEAELACNVLSLAIKPYLLTDSSIKCERLKRKDLGDFIRKIQVDCGYLGTLIRYNNLIINEEKLIPKFEGFSSFIKGAKCIVDKGYLKALEFIYTKCISKSSLIPNLFYLATNVKDYSLYDLENIKFAEKAMKDGVAPVVFSAANPLCLEDNLTSADLVSLITVPTKVISTLFPNPSWTVTTCRLGLAYSIIYGAEVLYNFSNITDDDIKTVLEEIFSMQYPTKKSFCSDYLYHISDSGHVEINPDLKACFDSDNEIRFTSFKNYFDKICPTLNCDLLADFEYYEFPELFAMIIQDMHTYAFQQCRIKHAIFIYQKAKATGLLDKDSFKNSILKGDNVDYGIFGGEEPLEELLNLQSLTTDDTESSIEDMLEGEKAVTDVAKEKGPQLNTMDALKKDLYDSMYDYDIEYVKNDISHKDAYYKIAKNISMITHNLAKQIKEIRTYNTGGKQNGLLVGKLDKKNLHRYKTDPHIFYNNNYKVKEMDLAFGCILDESGSMYGEKIKNGRIVMIMLHEVLTSLGINHSIIGHSGHDMYQSTIYKYYQFKEEPYFSLEKPYNLVTASARSCNCDSGALYYMQKVMKRVQNKDKIVIIFSDGQPTECTDLDLTNQVKAMEKDGIHVIGVGINFESIKDYYPDNANGKNLKEMVDIVVSILKRYVLEKKED